MLTSLLQIPISYLVLFLLLLYLGALTLPYIKHKKVTPAFQKEYKSKDFYSLTTGAERVSYVDDNSLALLYRLRMIEEAENEIILSTFDFNSDNAGKDIMSALIHAAERGVRVQVIVDGISGLSDMKCNPWFQALASIENVSVKVYNPVNILKPWKLQARLHDKYLIIDHKMYLLGGRNTSDLFLGDYSDTQNIDQELFLYETQNDIHSSLYQLRNYFTHVWKLPDSKDYLCKKKTKKIIQCKKDLYERYRHLKELYPKAYIHWNWEDITMTTNKVSLLYNPADAENKEPWMWYSIHRLMSQGRQIILYTPYIICGKEMYSDLNTLTSNNIHMEVITNDVASGANPFGCTDYLNQKKKVWATGIKVYEYMGTHSSHTKAVLVDNRMSIIGSYNLDMRSTYQDTELMLAVDCKELNQMIQEKSEKDKTYSKIIGKAGNYKEGTHYIPRKMSLPKLFFYTVLRIFVIPFRRFL